MKWVLDASLAAAAGLPDERAPVADRFLSQLTDEDEVWTPALFWFEIANIVTVAQRRNRITEATARELMALFASLPVKTDTAAPASVADTIRTIASRCSLSAYDAAYLELAERRGAGLATLDTELKSAASEAGVPVFELR